MVFNQKLGLILISTIILYAIVSQAQLTQVGDLIVDQPYPVYTSLESCNDSVLNSTCIYFKSNETYKYYECVSVGLAILRECPSIEMYFNFSSMSCVYNTTQSNYTHQRLIEPVDVYVFNSSSSNITNFTNTVDVQNSTNQSSRFVEVINIIDLVDISNETVYSLNISNSSTESNITLISRNLIEFNQTDLFNSTVYSNRTEDQSTESTLDETSTSTTTTTGTKPSRNMGLTCKAVGNCLNGECNKFTTTFNCICLAEYTGSSCETKIESNYTFEHILNNTFSIDNYINDSFVSNETVYYEKLIINLVDDLWVEINQEENFVHNFDYSTLLNQSNVAELVQKIRLYTKQSYFNFDKKFKLYLQVLDKLVDYLRTTSIDEQAVKFINDWRVTMNLTQESNNTNSNETRQARHLLGEPVEIRLRRNLNESYSLAKQLYKCYSDLIRHEQEVIFNAEIVEKYSNFSAKMVNTTETSWNKVVEYGFWYVTKKLANEMVIDGRSHSKRSLSGILKAVDGINTSFLLKKLSKVALDNGRLYDIIFKLVTGL